MITADITCECAPYPSCPFLANVQISLSIFVVNNEINTYINVS